MVNPTIEQKGIKACMYQAGVEQNKKSNFSKIYLYSSAIILGTKISRKNLDASKDAWDTLQKI